MVAPWRTLAADADAVIDDQFGEAARLVPMRDGTYQGPGRDPDRQPVDVVGVFVTSGDQAIGLAGDHAGRPLTQRIAVGDLFFSVRASQLGAFDPRVGDRLVLLDADRKGEAFEISRVPPEATGRIKIALVRAPE